MRHYDNDLIIRAAKGEEVERVPVWVMRQAGRILKEYKAIRGSLSGFKELVETPSLAAEVTIQPVDILGVDAAIIFSDILVIPEAMGLTYELIEKKGPWFPKTIESEKDISDLIIPNPEEKLAYVLDAIKLTVKELDGRVPLIGFAGAPWTIFSYMIEGQGSKNFSKARKLLYTHPELAHKLLDMITTSTIAYLKAQANAGAEILQVFDSWAGILGHEQYQEFGLKYTSRICDEVNEVPVTVFAKGAYSSISEMSALNCNTVGLDWNMNISNARNLLPGKTLQGNLDPCTLYASNNIIESKTKEMLNNFGKRGTIANLGHGVYPDTDYQKVKHFIDSVKNHKFEE